MRLVAVAVALVVAAPSAAADDRCATGLELAGSKPQVAFVHLEACIAAGGDKAEHRSAHRALKRQLDGGEYALITVATTPEDVAVAIEPLGVVITTGRIYLAPGNYTLEAKKDGHAPVTRPLEITGRYRETIELSLAVSGPKTGVVNVDLTEGPGDTELVRGKDPEHENLLPERYRRGQPTDREPAITDRRSRWPYAAVALGLLAAGVGVGLHLSDNTGAATGLYLAGGLGTAVGVTGLIFRW